MLWLGFFIFLHCLGPLSINLRLSLNYAKFSVHFCWWIPHPWSSVCPKVFSYVSFYGKHSHFVPIWGTFWNTQYWQIKTEEEREEKTGNTSHDSNWRPLYLMACAQPLCYSCQSFENTTTYKSKLNFLWTQKFFKAFFRPRQHTLVFNVLVWVESLSDLV